MLVVPPPIDINVDHFNVKGQCRQTDHFNCLSRNVRAHPNVVVLLSLVPEKLPEKLLSVSRFLQFSHNSLCRQQSDLHLHMCFPAGHTKIHSCCFFSFSQKASWQPHPDSEPQRKRCKSDLPLEDAILKDIVPYLEAESKVPVLG